MVQGCQKLLFTPEVNLSLPKYGHFFGYFPPGIFFDGRQSHTCFSAAPTRLARSSPQRPFAQELPDRITKMTLELYRTIVDKLPATPTKFHPRCGFNVPPPRRR